MTTGIEFHEAHFPGKAPIDAYGNGGFRFGEMSHRGSLLCLPSGVYGWDVVDMEDLNPSAFEQVVGDTGEIEVFLLGTGKDLCPVPKQLREFLNLNGIRVDSMATGSAVRTYNVLLSENRAVGAGFLAV